MPEPFELRVEADTSGFTAAMDDLERSARRAGSAVGDAFRGAALEGRSFGDVLRDLASKLADVALDAAVAPIERGAANLFSGLAASLAGAVAPAPQAAPARAAASPVTFNVTTPDAESFRRAEGQVAAMLTRSAMRGRRSL